MTRDLLAGRPALAAAEGSVLLVSGRLVRLEALVSPGRLAPPGCLLPGRLAPAEGAGGTLVATTTGLLGTGLPGAVEGGGGITMAVTGAIGGGITLVAST